MNTPRETFNLAKYHKTRIGDMETLQPTTPPKLSKKKTYLDDQSTNENKSPLGQTDNTKKVSASPSLPIR